MNSNPKSEEQFSLKYQQLQYLQEIFGIRHQLIHNPNINYSIPKDIHLKIQSAQMLLCFQSLF